jgi:GT2 family glycosyltransferase
LPNQSPSKFKRFRRKSRVPSTASQLGTGPRLTPLRDVRLDGDQFIAESDEPWLSVEFEPSSTPRGQWARIVYRSSFLDPLIRPMLRLTLDHEWRDFYMPGAVHGRGVWLGFIPEETREIRISPVARKGPFGFEIEKLETISASRLLRKAMRGSREKTFAWISARMRGMSFEALEEISYALCHEPMAQYQAWRRKRLRSFEPRGIDRPRHDWRDAPHIRFAINLRQGSAPFLSRLLTALGAQPYPNWSVVAIGAPDLLDAKAFATALEQRRLIRLDATATARDIAIGLAPTDLVGRCAARDGIPESALAILAERALEAPKADIFYGDEDRMDRDGRYFAPSFKPDWSPLFEAEAGYMGAAAFARAALLADARTPAARFADPGKPIGDGLTAAATRVEHVRRILLSRAGAGRSRPIDRPMVATAAPVSEQLAATIIVPTRDRVDLLRACLTSAMEKAGAIPFEVIVVDNGSVEPASLAYLADLGYRKNVRILRRPGPFNFSALCNDAAANARGGTLVFLNNDTQALTPDWLARLVALARKPEVGAVGARLLYPSGRLQHAGVVVGLVGRAGHVNAGLEQDEPSYLREVETTRETTAVTGACLAVEKSKFDAVRGFNARDLPIDLNDVDLCLRLRENGLTNIYTPHCELIHHESESRKQAAQPSKVYAREWAYFIARWGSVMRDDPYFHPALSLHSVRPALG